MKTILAVGAVFCGYIGIVQPFLTGRYSDVSMMMAFLMILCLMELGRELVKE